jgi:hypothetical protein
MKNWKQILSLLLSLALIVSLCACSAEDSGGTESPSASPDASAGDSSENPDASLDPDVEATPEIEVDLDQDATTFSAGISPDEELLTVNGTPVNADLALYWLGMSCSNFMSQYGYFGLSLADVIDEEGATFGDQMRDSAVTIGAYNILIQKKAAELGCLPTDEQIAEAKERMMAEGEENYEMMKTAFGLTDETMEYLYLSNSYYENVLDVVVPTATDEMLNNYAYQAKHILLKTIDDSQQPLSDEEIAKKKKQAEDFLAQLQAADDLEAKFDELMNEYSEDGRNEDGALAAPDGYTAVLGDMVPEFEAGALALKPGEISGLVETSYGYHIILRGEVEDIQSYADECREYHLDDELEAMLDETEIVRSAALDELDVTDFFNRYSAYQNAVFAKYQPEDSGDDLGPVSSDGVG